MADKWCNDAIDTIKDIISLQSELRGILLSTSWNVQTFFHFFGHPEPG